MASEELPDEGLGGLLGVGIGWGGGLKVLSIGKHRACDWVSGIKSHQTPPG